MKLRLLLSSLVILISLNTYSQEIRTTKEVNNVKEFFDALGNNTEIIILCDTLDFTYSNLETLLKIENSEEHWSSDASPIKRKNQSYFLADGIVLHGYKNLKIKGIVSTKVISTNEFDDILTFKNCENLILENLAIFHTPETCNGSVISLISSNQIEINNCALNGSGGVGAELIGTNNANFYNVEIFNNVFFAVRSVNSSAINFESCHIYSNHDWSKALIYSDLSSLTFKKCLIEYNEAPNLLRQSSEKIRRYYPKFIKCEFVENAFDFDNYKIQDETSRQNNENKIALKLFLEILTSELGSDHDSSNDEILSFFSSQYSAICPQIENTNQFMPFYYHLKREYSSATISVNEIEQISDRMFKVFMENSNIEENVVWNFHFDDENKIEKFEDNTIYHR